MDNHKDATRHTLGDTMKDEIDIVEQLHRYIIQQITIAKDYDGGDLVLQGINEIERLRSALEDANEKLEIANNATKQLIWEQEQIAEHYKKESARLKAHIKKFFDSFIGLVRALEKREKETILREIKLMKRKKE